MPSRRRFVKVAGKEQQSHEAASANKQQTTTTVDSNFLKELQQQVTEEPVLKLCTDPTVTLRSIKLITDKECDKKHAQHTADFRSNNQAGDFRSNNQADFRSNDQAGFRSNNQAGDFRSNNQTDFRSNNQAGDFRSNNQAGDFRSNNQAEFKSNNQAGDFRSNNQADFRSNEHTDKSVDSRQEAVTFLEDHPQKVSGCQYSEEPVLSAEEERLVVLALQEADIDSERPVPCWKLVAALEEFRHKKFKALNNLQATRPSSKVYELTGSNNNLSQATGSNNNLSFATYPNYLSLATGTNNNLSLAKGSNNNHSLATGSKYNLSLATGSNKNLSQATGSNNNLSHATYPNNNLSQATGSNNNLDKTTGSNNNIAGPKSNLKQATYPNNNLLLVEDKTEFECLDLEQQHSVLHDKDWSDDQAAPSRTLPLNPGTSLQQRYRVGRWTDRGDSQVLEALADKGAVKSNSCMGEWVMKVVVGVMVATVASLTIFLVRRRGQKGSRPRSISVIRSQKEWGNPGCSMDSSSQSQQSERFIVSSDLMPDLGKRQSVPQSRKSMAPRGSHSGGRGGVSSWFPWNWGSRVPQTAPNFQTFHMSSDLAPDSSSGVRN